MQSDRPSSRSILPLVLALFFLSGALALVYQVVWARMMTHIFGSTALAVGTVLAGFMSGMALGSWLAGRIADRTANCLRLYAWLEIGIAAAAIAVHLLLDALQSGDSGIYRMLGGSSGTVALVRFLLVFLLVMAPTLLMGATLPVLTRHLVRRAGAVGGRLSSLYAINTLGAVCGVLLTGFYLIGTFGVHAPVYFAVAGNLAVGCVAWLAAGRSAGAAEPAPAMPETARDGPGQTPLDPWGLRLVVVGLGVSGFTSFAYEIYWTRSLVFLLGNSTYAMTTMLAAFLTGIALGGFAIRFLLARLPDQAAMFGWIQVLLGLLSALALPMLFGISEPQAVERYLADTATEALPLVLSGFGVAFLVMLGPAVLIGATFPLVGAIVARDVRTTGTDVGSVYAVNTWGNVLGALLPGVFLIAWLGIQRGILLMAGLNVVLGFTILYLRLWPRPGRPQAHPAWRLALPVLLIATVLLMGRAPLDFQFPSEGELPHHETLFYREGPLATTKVFRDPLLNEKHMSVDGITIGGTGNTEFKQLLLAHLPKLLLDDVSSELSVGVGSGILAGESALHPRVKRITGVEIEPSVVEGAALFGRENHAVLQDPKLRVVVDDIGNFLRTNSERYRVISADEKTADEYASNGFSYSREYYELLLGHLEPGGLVAQWVPTTLPPRQYRMVLKTFAGVFPHVQLWYFLPAYKRGPFNTILIGSHEPVALDPRRIDERFAAEPEAFASLQRYGITSADALLPHFIAADGVLRDAVAAAEINSLDFPRYEFYRPWNYARDRAEKVVENHEMLIDLKREAYPDLLTALSGKVRDRARLRQGLEAEERYLRAFSKFLTGISLDEAYRIFDDALAVAPWNDSLRARIYAQYRYLAESRRDPGERALLMRRAEALYPERRD
jgi:spermidine synthase